MAIMIVHPPIFGASHIASDNFSAGFEHRFSNYFGHVRVVAAPPNAG
jgi:hypothetical protein